VILQQGSVVKKEREFSTRHMPDGPGQSIVQFLYGYRLIFCSNYPSMNQQTAILGAGDVQTVRYEDDGSGFT
jgi:hypothetical protein